MLDLLSKLIDLFHQPIFKEALLIAQIVASVLILFFIGAILYFLRKSSYMRFRFLEDTVEILSFRQYAGKKSEKEWQNLIKKLETSSEAEWKLAVLEAESILDEALQRLSSVKGESFTEKLKALEPGQLKNIDKILEAHKVRSNIVYDPDYILSQDEAKRILGVYEKALRELGVF